MAKKETSQNNVILEIAKSKVNLPFVSELSVTSAATKIHHELMEGTLDPIKVTSMFKFSTDTYAKLKELTDENGKNSLADMVRESIELNADDKKNLITEAGIKFSLAEVGTSYDFSKCNCSEWVALDNQIKDLTAKKKEREKFLKGINDMITVAVPDLETGELVITEIYAPTKSSTSSFKSEFVKEKK
jgi:hypothetical protein